MSDSPKRLDTAATRLSRSTPLYDQARAHDAGRALARVAESRRARHRALAAWPDVTASVDLRDRAGQGAIALDGRAARPIDLEGSAADPIDLDGSDGESVDLDGAAPERAEPRDGRALARPDDGTAALSVPAVPAGVMPEPIPGPDPVPSPDTPPAPAPTPAPEPLAPAPDPLPGVDPVIAAAPPLTVGLRLVVHRPAPGATAERLERLRAALRAEQPRALVLRLPEADPAWSLDLPEVVHVEEPAGGPAEPLIDLRDPVPVAVFDDADRFLAHLLEVR